MVPVPTSPAKTGSEGRMKKTHLLPMCTWKSRKNAPPHSLYKDKD